MFDELCPCRFGEAGHRQSKLRQPLCQECKCLVWRQCCERYDGGVGVVVLEVFGECGQRGKDNGGITAATKGFELRRAHAICFVDQYDLGGINPKRAVSDLQQAGSIAAFAKRAAKIPQQSCLAGPR